ncbi:hypothetical protein [Wenxinia saemankumensis]|uniref:Uncharacterized protein n=1 Tax=Wenxinia saemankumensis TaxID=1447782 RepID=A0A1M6CC88_9RHOB|nr:hypothetical protein [Wenxinia saemankumensis]SHI58441.1 hypothetical protein SAMN05444417_1113 [Wenxinia saemankumensis]
MKGSHPVGQLTDLDPAGRVAVAAFRGDGRELCPAPLRDLCALCARHGRRPLACHGAGCPCLGGDEACFARLIELAAGGEQEEALMLAMLLVRADLAPLAVALAQQAALALRRGPAAPSGTIH